MQKTARVVVVGGGVIGCSVLYHLAKKGWSDVVLCERTELTAGSTWHAAGNVISYTLDETISRLNQYGSDLYARLEADTGVPSGYHRCGNLRLATHPDRLDEFRRYLGLAQQTGVEARLVTPQEIEELWPFMNVEGVLGGLYNPGDGHIAPADLTLSYAAGARKYGAKIHRNTEVTGFTETTEGWVVHTSGGDIACEHVVSCTGNYTKQTMGFLGLPAHVVSLRHQYIVTEAIPELAERRKKGLPEMPVMRDPEQLFYCRQEGDGLVMGAYEGRGETCFVDGVPANFGMDLFPDQLDELLPYLEAAIERIPHLKTVGLRSIINGPQPYTPDDLPYTGPAFGKRNFWLGEGNPFGVTLSGGIGWQLAEWIVEGAPSIDMSPCDSRRFGKYATRTWAARKTEEAYERTYLIPKPGEELAAARMLKVSAVHDVLAQRGAVFGAVYGWERPNWFVPDGVSQDEQYSFYRSSYFDHVGEEVRAARGGLVLSDISHTAKFRVNGPGTDDYISGLITGDLPAIGQHAIGYVMTAAGGFRAVFDVARLAHDDMILQAGPAREMIDWDLLTKSAPTNVRIDNLTGREGALLLSGPGAADLLARLSVADIADKKLEPMDEVGCPVGAVKEMICGYAPIRLHRTDPFSVSGYELHCESEFLRHVLLQILDGSDARLIGARALEVLRLEQGQPALGTELTPMMTPVQAGLQPGDSDHVLVQLELRDTAPVDPIGHESVGNASGRVIGHTTSGGHGHSAGRGLAFAMIERSALKDSEGLSIRILDTAYPARILAGAVGQRA